MAHSSPTAPEHLVGREIDLDLVASMLAQAGTRLVTITGTGGVGKTSLALQVAHRIAAEQGRRLVIAELAAVIDASLVGPILARLAGLDAEAGDDLMPGLLAALDGTPMLLVLDNLEHLGVDDLVGRLVDETSTLRILATSRRRLGIRGELVYPLPPLPLPDRDPAPTLHDLASNPAVALLLKRMQEAQPRLIVTQENAEVLLDLSLRLEGIPLAIELAARNARVLSIQDIRDQFAARQDILHRDDRNHPHRLRAMEASVSWSLELLPEQARSDFRQLCLFRNPFDYQLARDSCGISPDQLERLADHGLLSVLPQATGPNRFRILEPIREQGIREAERRGDLDPLQARYARAMFGMAERIGRREGISGTSADVERLARSMDDFFAALDWSLVCGDPVAAMRAAADAHLFWSHWPDPATSRRWLDRLVDAARNEPGCPPDILGELLFRASEAAYHASDWDWSETLAGDAIDIGRAHELNGILARALIQRMILSRSRHDADTALSLAGEALDAAMTHGDPWVLRSWYYERTALALERHDYAEAERYIDTAIELSYQAPANWEGIDRGFPALMALVHIARAEHDLARACLRNGLENPNSSETSKLAFRQGLLEIDLREGKLAAAAFALRECLDARARRGSPRWINACLIDAAWLAAMSGDDLRSAELFGAASIDDRQNIRLLVADIIDSVVASLVDRLGHNRYRSHVRLGAMRDRKALIGETMEWLASFQDRPEDIPESLRPVLSPRERQILELIAGGASNRAVAEALSISPATAATHVKRIHRKLGVGSRAAAVSAGLRLGLIDQGEA